MHVPIPRWIIALFVTLIGGAGAAVAAWSVELPYFAFSPGPVGDVLDAVEVTEDLEIFPADGELLMLTVSLQEVNVYEVAAAALDPSVDLVRRQLVRRAEETDEEFKQRALQSMDDAVFTAVAVALDRLGIPATSDGVEVEEVFDDYPAAQSLEAGDVIVAVEGRLVTLAGDIAEALVGRSPGDLVTLEIRRGGSVESVTVELGTATDDPDRPMIGVRVSTLNPRLPVEIESGNIGGPSAGLMYTLGVIDLLSEGDLTKGHVVAGTGTIAVDGSVGPIGGVRQKVVAAEAAGAGVILVPAANYEQALTAPRSTIEVVSVSNIDDALAFLESLSPA